jgi:penicillin-binding protein 1A
LYLYAYLGYKRCFLSQESNGFKGILELYLGRVYFGAGAYGVDAAAERYFAKPASDLSLGECAMLAGLLKAPSRYSPASNAKLTSARTTTVLQNMVAAKALSPAQRDAVFATPIYVEAPEPQNSHGYFIDWAWKQMVAEIGLPTQDMTVQTTLAGPAQIRGELAISARLNPKRGASQAALVSMDGTGAVRAMIGGANYHDSKFNRAANALRQPGSAFKPFGYLTAFKNGAAPHDTRIDGPVQIGDWEPGNFSDEYIGEVTLAKAFTKSLNTVAVLLSEEAGRGAVAQTAADFGLTGLRPLRSIALGAQEVTPLALTQSYLPFANYGYSAKAYAIETIYTSGGRALYQRKPTGSKRIIDGKALRDMNLIMHMTIEGGTGRNARIEGYDLAGKTGTTNDYRDAWFIGYAPDYVTGVWVGADDNSPMAKVTGGSIPARIWRDYMEGALEGMPKTSLPKSVMPQVIEIAAATPVIVVTAPAPKPVAEDSALGRLLSSIESKLP